MAILFSLSHHNDFNKKNGEKMVIVLSQTERTVDVNEVAKYAVSHYAPEMHYTQLLKSIDILKQTIIDMLKDGNRVSLGDLGTFFYHIDSKAMPESEFQEKGFHPSRDIKDVTVKWTASNELKSLKQHGELEFKQRSYIYTRKALIKERMRRPDADE